MFLIKDLGRDQKWGEGCLRKACLNVCRVLYFENVEICRFEVYLGVDGSGGEFAAHAAVNRFCLRDELPHDRFCVIFCGGVGKLFGGVRLAN